MAKVYTSASDEEIIKRIQNKGLSLRTSTSTPKWPILRLALTRSLKFSTPPDEALDRRDSIGSEYSFEQLTGQDNKAQPEDFTDLFRALLSVYHNQNLFGDDDRYAKYLQRHIRRGLREFATSWRESHDFHEYLYQELLSDLRRSAPSNGEKPQDQPSIENALRDIGVQAEIRQIQEGARLTRYRLYLADVNDRDRLNKGLQKLGFILGLGNQGALSSGTDESRTMNLDIPRSSEAWQRFSGAELRTWLQNRNSEWRLPVYPGVDVMGDPFGFDLAEAPHLLVGGTTGSGKSVTLHALLISLLHSCSPADLQVCLIDPKRVEFNSYQGIPHLYANQVVTNAGDAAEVLGHLVAEMGIREEQLVKAGVRDIDEARRSHRLNLPRIVIFVEEMADLVMQNEEIEFLLVRLAQKARSAGIHLVLATQRPDAETFSGLLRSNIPSRIALTVQKASESRIILDDNGAELLLGRGDMLVRLIGQPIKRVHGVHVTIDDIALAVKTVKGRV